MEYRNIIEQAVAEIFSTMLFLEVTPQTGEPSTINEERMLSGMLGFAGDLQGTVLIHLPATVAIAITNAFLELDLDEVDDEVKDAIGELTNMVAGGIKFLLPEQQRDVQLSIPSVISGKGYTCATTGKALRCATGFETDGGPFVVEFLVK